MPRIHNLYIFLRERTSDEDSHDISRNLVFTYVNRFIIDEEALVEISQIRELNQELISSKIPKNIRQNFFYTEWRMNMNPFKIIEETIRRASNEDNKASENHFIFETALFRYESRVPNTKSYNK